MAAYLVEQRASPHVGDGDEGHDDERADEVALGPGLDDERVGIGGFLHDIATGLEEARKGTHGGCKSGERPGGVPTAEDGRFAL